MNARRWASSALAVVFTALLVFAGLMLWFDANQRRLVFVADTKNYTPADFGMKGWRAVTVESAPGVKLAGWYWPPASPDMKTVVYFHGNVNCLGIALNARVPETIAAAGYGFLFATYRGYNGNPGMATEAALYEDARAWLRSLDTPMDQIVLYGMSLGTGIATQMAVENPDIAGVVLETPYTDAAALVRLRSPYVPFHWILRHRFDNRARIGAISKPVLLLHGTADDIVPIEQGRALCESAPDCTMKIYDGGRHDDLHRHGAQIDVIKFLRRATGHAPA